MYKQINTNKCNQKILNMSMESQLRDFLNRTWWNCFDDVTATTVLMKVMAGRGYASDVRPSLRCDTTCDVTPVMGDLTVNSCDDVTLWSQHLQQSHEHSVTCVSYVRVPSLSLSQESISHQPCSQEEVEEEEKGEEPQGNPGKAYKYRVAAVTDSRDVKVRDRRWSRW